MHVKAKDTLSAQPSINVSRIMQLTVSFRTSLEDIGPIDIS